jgi:Replicative DNA helicase
LRPSSEALLIGALVNNDDASLGTTHGVDPEMLVGYQAEYRWVLNFQTTYGNAPSWDALLHKFPTFPKTDNVDAAFAADEVRYSASQRAMRAAVRSAASHISEGDYEQAAMALASYTPLASVKPAVNALLDTSFLDVWDEKPETIAWPWISMNHLTGGIRRGDLVYVAARFTMGKSWNAASIIAQALLDGNPVNLFTLEMSKAQVLTRLHVVLGNLLGFSTDHIAMRDKTYDAIAYRRLVNKIRDEVPGRLFIYDSGDGRCTPAMISARADDASLTVIDHVGLMSTAMGKRSIEDWRTAAEISNVLKEVTVAKDTRIIALAQINRAGDSISKYPPKAKDIAQSDAIGQDADVVITHKQFSRTSQILSLEKNRSGPDQRYMYTRFLPNEGRFHEISKETAEDLRDKESDD